jgi:hypothetical protein
LRWHHGRKQATPAAHEEIDDTKTAARESSTGSNRVLLCQVRKPQQLFQRKPQRCERADSRDRGDQ